MSTAMRFVLFVVCSVLSLPAALFGLAGSLAGAFEPCGIGALPGACAHGHHVSQVALVMFVVAWILYGWLALCWLADKRPGRGARVVGTACALGYSVLAMVEAPNLGVLGVLALTILPVLPAVLLATYLVFLYRPRERAPVRRSRGS